jgi:hypothetical protein
VNVAAVVDDLITFSRIQGAADAAGASVIRVDDPQALPDQAFDLVLVDWASRHPGWAEALMRRADRRIVLFGAHTDLEAHAAARASGLGPMWARSKLVADLPQLVRDASPEPPPADGGGASGPGAR